MKKHIRDFRETKKKLLNRSDELRKRASTLKYTKPNEAAVLQKRSETLKAEAEKMTKKKHLSMDEIRRKAVAGFLALEIDDIKANRK